MAGIFYQDTESESLDVKNARIKEFKDIAHEIINKVKNVPNEAFPEFLWKPMTNDFEMDDYKIRGMCKDRNVQLAYTLLRKYQDYNDYLDAIEVYYDYADYIEKTYGNFEMYARSPSSLIYIPHMPKLTNKKKNKIILRSGFVPSRITADSFLTEDTLEEEIESLPIYELSFDEDYELPKRVRRAQEEMFDNKVRRDRISSIYIYGSRSYNPGVDAIINYLTGNDSFISQTKPEEGIVAIIEEIRKEEEMSQDEIDNQVLQSGFLLQNGAMVSPAQAKKMEILKTLEENGFNFLKANITNGLDSKSIRMVKRITDYDESADLTPKQIRKLRKKREKEKQRSKEKDLGDSRLQEVLLKHRVNMNVGDIANFKLSDVIPSED